MSLFCHLPRISSSSSQSLRIQKWRSLLCLVLVPFVCVGIFCTYISFLCVCMGLGGLFCVCFSHFFLCVGLFCVCTRLFVRAQPPPKQRAVLCVCACVNVYVCVCTCVCQCVRARVNVILTLSPKKKNRRESRSAQPLSLRQSSRSRLSSKRYRMCANTFVIPTICRLQLCNALQLSVTIYKTLQHTATPRTRCHGNYLQPRVHISPLSPLKVGPLKHTCPLHTCIQCVIGVGPNLRGEYPG